MASYTDNIPKFNPYVQTIPVDEMVQVGMYKQQKYEEGIQKIQTNIDNIAGLDVANDADKAYLQSKLNQLGNNLVSVAAGDFSNFQLVNSVNGMTNQIARDSNVQTAVASTAKLRKEQQRKEKAIQDGKSSPENEFVFNMQVSEYLNSSKIGQSFNGQFVEYRDVDKKLRGLVSDLQKAGFEQTIDNPWVRDNLGRDVYFNPDGTQSLDGSKGGTRKFDMVKLTTKIKGVGAQRILNNFYDSLDEGDKRQLNITAQYHYRNATPITFQNDIIRTYNEKKKMYSDAIVDATVKLATGNLTPEQKVALENDINTAKKLVFEGGFDIQMREEMAAVDTEAETTAYKYKIYTQKYLTNLAKDLANETKSIEYNSNAGFQAIMDKKKFEFDVEKERQREREWQADFALKLKKDRREEEEAERKRKEEVSLQPIVSTEKIPTDFPKYGINELDVDVDNVNAELTQTKSKLAMLLDPSAFAEKDKKKREEKIKVAMNSANAVYEQYREKPHIIKDNRQRQLLEDIDRLSDKKYTLITKLDAANEAGSVYSDKVNKVINQQNGIKIGKDSYTAVDIYDINNFTGRFIKRFSGAPTSMGPGTSYSVMTKDLLNYYKGKKEYPIALAIYNDYNGIELSPDQKVIINQINKINNNVSKEVRQLKEQAKVAQSKAIYDLSPEFQQMNIQLNPDNKRDMNVVNQIIGLKLKDYNDRGALDTKRPDDFVPETIAKMTGEGKKPGYTYIKNYDGSATLIITEGQNVQKIPLTATEFRNWVTDYSYVNPMSDVISAVQGSKYKTTNTAGRQQGSTARYTGNSPLLPGFNNTKMASKVRMDIEGSPDNIGNADTDVFQARLYYYDGNQWKDEVLNTGGYVDAANLQILLSQTGQKTIETLFK